MANYTPHSSSPLQHGTSPRGSSGTAATEVSPLANRGKGRVSDDEILVQGLAKMAINLPSSNVPHPVARDLHALQEDLQDPDFFRRAREQDARDFGAVGTKPGNEPFPYGGHDHGDFANVDPVYVNNLGNPAGQYRGTIRPFRGTHWNMRDNTVDELGILDGSDVRTTVMVRNMPNLMTAAQFNQLLWEVGLDGFYDFSYLRMDFRTGANVGYAFLNFINPIHILELMRALNGRRWNGHPHRRPAEISYATSQGLEALVAKFRNSSVMREAVGCRPKLFFTMMDGIPEQYWGVEKLFPLPDNDQKLLRSIQNAQVQGLYPPNSRNAQTGTGAGFRQMRGMHDRGNPRDLPHHPPFHGLNHGHPRPIAQPNQFFYARYPGYWYSTGY